MSNELSREDLERYDISHRFSLRLPTAATGPKHDEVLAMHRNIALWVLANVPASRERSIALTNLQESMMWCNAGVAIYTEPEPLRFDVRDEA